jgi:hypothetical protein
VNSEPNRPAVKDTTGKRYVCDGRGGWRAEDADEDEPSMTWRALTHEVPNDGELRVDHDNKR